MYQYQNDLADEQAAEEYQKEVEVFVDEIDYVQISYDCYEEKKYF